MTIKAQFSAPKVLNRVGVVLLFLLDIATLILIFHIAVLFRVFIIPQLVHNLPEFTFSMQMYIWIFPIWAAIMIFSSGYTKRFAFWDEVQFLWKSAFFASLTTFALLFIMKRGQDYSRILILTIFFVSLPVLPLVRIKIKKLLYRAGLMRRKALLIGSGETAKKALAAISNEPNLGYEISGAIDDVRSTLGELKVHKGIDGVERYIKAAGIHDVIIAKPELSRDALVNLINHVQHKAENTLYIPDISGIAVTGTQLRYFFQAQTMLIEVKNNLANPLFYGIKRSIDYVAGLTCAILLLPLMGAIAAAIKIDSKGPAILKQKRLGKNAREFYCYKFRSMFPDAEERLKQLLENDQSAKEEYEKYWKLIDDPRITRAGNILRKTSLDELPQILNIIRGEMSLIGPRPYLPREWEHIKDESPIIHGVPPGITGLWQVSGRNNNDYNYRITMDSWYVKNWNLWLDIMILLKTFSVVLRRDGAR